MKPIIAITIGFLAVLLSSCSTTSSTLPALNRAYAGKNSDDFFVRHGSPASEYKLNSGGKIYKWNSSLVSYNIPATTTHTGNVGPYGNYYGTSTTSGGGSLDVYTILRIKTDPADRIRSIEIEKDTIGKWTLSRFSELFKEYDSEQGAGG